MSMDVIDYEIFGDDMQYVEIDLDLFGPALRSSKQCRCEFIRTLNGMRKIAYACLTRLQQYRASVLCRDELR